MSVQSDLLAEIEAFLAEHGKMNRSTFGVLATHDGSLVANLRAEKGMTVTKVARVQQFIADQRALLARERPPAPEPAAEQAAKPARRSKAA